MCGEDIKKSSVAKSHGTHREKNYTILMIYRSQLLFESGLGLSNRRFFVVGRFRIDHIKNRGTNKNGEEESDYIHTDTEKKILPAADCVEGCSFHWILD